MLAINYGSGLVVVLISFVLGFYAGSVERILQWIVGGTVRRLRGRQRVQMVLVALQRDRFFLGHGRGDCCSDCSCPR